MSDEKIAQLLRHLLQATREGRLSWKPFGNSGMDYTLPLSTAKIEVGAGLDIEGQRIYRVNLRDPRGTLLRTLQLDADDDLFETVRDLYKLIRSGPLPGDDMIDSIIAEVAQARQTSPAS